MKGRRNSTWQDMGKDSTELSRLVQFYEIFDRSESKTARTVNWYNEVLSLFLRWLKSQDKATTLGSISEMEVRQFILYLQQKRWNGKPLSSHTVNNRVRALRAFFSWLAREGYSEMNLLARLKPPRVTRNVSCRWELLSKNPTALLPLLPPQACS